MGVLDALAGGGVTWAVQLERDGLLPGRLAACEVSITTPHDLEVRGAVASLIATEHWRADETTTDMNGHPTTRTVKHDEVVCREPVQLLETTTLSGGVPHVLRLSMPVPPLGPATFEGTETGLTWELEIHLDVPGLDPRLRLPIRVLQPTALLRAGVIDLPALALYPSADADADEVRASIAVDPVPLCVGASFHASVALELERALDLQEVRAELVVNARSTVSGGRHERLVLWSARIGDAGRYAGHHDLSFHGELSGPCCPTSLLPHGRADGRLEVTLARAWARDSHLGRDVAVCSTTEL